MAETTQYVKNVAPAKLELLIAIVHNDKVRYFTSLIQESEANLHLAVQASGTSENALANYLGLNQATRTAIFSVVREDKVKELLELLDEKFNTINGGTGLGLPICRKIATQLGGEAKLDLKHQGKGARFIFTHPVVA